MCGDVLVGRRGLPRRDGCTSALVPLRHALERDALDLVVLQPRMIGHPALIWHRRVGDDEVAADVPTAMEAVAVQRRQHRDGPAVWPTGVIGGVERRCTPDASSAGLLVSRW
jgi:hypothetical protein